MGVPSAAGAKLATEPGDRADRTAPSAATQGTRVPWRAVVWQATAIWAATRVAYIGFTYVAVVLNQSAIVASPAPVPASLLLQSWQHWDTNWYLSIAAVGYNVPQTTAFFPLYPLLIHAVSWLTGPQNALVAALIVSNLGTLGAFITIALLAASEAGQADAAWRTIRIFAAYPLAFFLTAAYTEGLFIAFAAGTLLCARRGQWRWAAVLAFLAALTRATGLALVLPLIYEYGRQHGWWQRLFWRTEQWRAALRPAALAQTAYVVGAVPAAFAAFSLFCWVRFHDPIMWLRAERLYWGHQRLAIWQVFIGAFHTAFDHPGLTDVQVRTLFNVVPLLLVLILTLVSIRRMPFAFTLYALGVFYLAVAEPIPTMNNYVTSDGRYMLAAVPIFLLLGQWTERRPWLDLLLVSGGFLAQALLAVTFLHGGGIN